jgi:serine/threonine protein kinase
VSWPWHALPHGTGPESCADAFSQSVDSAKHPCIVYPVCVGGSLATAYSGALSADQRLSVALAAARGLAALHASRVVHHDIKSSNVLLIAKPDSPGWELFGDPSSGSATAAVLADMGVCYVLPDGDSSSCLKCPAGEHVHDYDYWAPEFVRDGYVSRASDVYAFGVTLCELLCGKLVYRRDVGQVGLVDEVRLVLKKRTQSPALVAVWGEHTLERLLALTSTCIRCTPARRPDAEDVATDLKTILLAMRTVCASQLSCTGSVSRCLKRKEISDASLLCSEDEVVSDTPL